MKERVCKEVCVCMCVLCVSERATVCKEVCVCVCMCVLCVCVCERASL